MEELTCSTRDRSSVIQGLTQKLSEEAEPRDSTWWDWDIQEAELGKEGYEQRTLTVVFLSQCYEHLHRLSRDTMMTMRWSGASSPSTVDSEDVIQVIMTVLHIPKVPQKVLVTMGVGSSRSSSSMASMELMCKDNTGNRENAGEMLTGQRYLPCVVVVKKIVPIGL